MATVLVTGSSSGFGELIVKTLATTGHRVFASMEQMLGRPDQATPWSFEARRGSC